MPVRFRPIARAAGWLACGAGLAASPVAAQSAAGNVDHGALRDRSLAVLEVQFGAFRRAATSLAAASRAYCDGDIERAGYLEAFAASWRAWAPLDAYQFGPVEQRAAVLTVAFWPDKKDYVGRGLEALLELPAESLSEPDTIVQGSAAAQGLPAIERLLFSDLAECPAVIGIAGHVEGMARLLYDDWFAADGWADVLRSAGPENPVYRSEAEVTKALYTALSFELTVIADARLGRPLGTFDAPNPAQAEAWRAGLSFDIIDAQLQGIARMLDAGFADALPEAVRREILDAVADTRDRLAQVGAPLDAAVADPMLRIRVEALQTQVRYLQTLFAEAIGPALDVETGFSPADGD